MRLVGLSGGIACGKSSVCELIRVQVPVIDLDALGHAVLDWKSTRRAIAQTWGESLLLENGRVNREALSKHVFGSRQEMSKLNRIMHWRMAASLFATLAWHFCKCTPVLVLDAPLLFETRLDVICAASVAVHAPRAVQLLRLQQRDGIDAGAAANKVDAQMSADAKAERATIVISTDCDREEMEWRVRTQLLPWLTRRRLVWSWQLFSMPAMLLLLCAAAAARA
mmetsp:Transcript_9541/g.20504  ORF Transcript_9541/g.20504 Transcript_9541/m.20504 type:complete len:224 (-) Transcript_9541:145-816(-)